MCDENSQENLGGLLSRLPTCGWPLFTLLCVCVSACVCACVCVSERERHIYFYNHILIPSFVSRRSYFHSPLQDFLLTPTCQYLPNPLAADSEAKDTSTDDMREKGGERRERGERGGRRRKGLTYGDVINEYVSDVMTMPASLAGN